MLFICILGGYLVGSIPTAYLIVRLKSGIDLRTKGSSNIGALNVYNVTRSKWTGITVGLLDGVKGFLVVLIAGELTGGSFWIQSSALFSAIIGHNYPVWLRFHGGRGLASAAGGMFAIGIGYTLIWCLIWFISFKYLKNILRANLAAIFLTPIILLFIPSIWIGALMIREVFITDYRIFSFIMSGVLLLSHWQPLKEIIRSKHPIVRV
jgi:glycerol-3-phosphate acyltransferase PlsY